MKFLFKTLFIWSAFASILPACFSEEAARKEPEPFKILVYTRTTGSRHASIPDGIEAVKKMRDAGNFVAEFTEDPAKFTDENLKQFAVVVFLNTTGNILDDTGKAAFQKFVESGGGFVGIHAATDTEHGWLWYNKTVGAYFMDHPKIQPACIDVLDTKHATTSHLPERRKITDEWYNFKNIQPGSHVLINLDETTYKGGKHGKNHPLSWTRTVGKGRVFYTGLGHRPEIYSDPDFVIHVRNALLWAAGKKTENQ